LGFIFVAGSSKVCPVHSGYKFASCAVALWLAVAGSAGAASRGPVIRHDPVKVGVRGQSLSVRAVVTDSSSTIKGVYLYYTTSRDAAPYKLTMLGTGAGGYLATIPGALLGSAPQVLYYIEAVNEQDVSAETSYCSVELRLPQAATGGAAGTEETGKSWVKPTLYAGGAAVLVGAAILATSGGGGGGGEGGSTTNAGSYAGTVTTCFELAGSTPSCRSNAMRIFISTDGVVNSDTLREGVYVEGRVSGRDFTIMSPVSETNLTGQIRYDGTVIDRRITGSISGSARTTSGVNGTYSGTFNATLQ
jgi:hypothetical protein